jgi:hypothetical protein
MTESEKVLSIFRVFADTSATTQRGRYYAGNALTGDFDRIVFDNGVRQELLAHRPEIGFGL